MSKKMDELISELNALATEYKKFRIAAIKSGLLPHPNAQKTAETSSINPTQEGHNDKEHNHSQQSDTKKCVDGKPAGLKLVDIPNNFKKMLEADGKKIEAWGLIIDGAVFLSAYKELQTAIAALLLYTDKECTAKALQSVLTAMQYCAQQFMRLGILPSTDNFKTVQSEYAGVAATLNAMSNQIATIVTAHKLALQKVVFITTAIPAGLNLDLSPNVQLVFKKITIYLDKLMTVFEETAAAPRALLLEYNTTGAIAGQANSNDIDGKDCAYRVLMQTNTNLQSAKTFISADSVKSDILAMISNSDPKLSTAERDQLQSVFGKVIGQKINNYVLTYNNFKTDFSKQVEVALAPIKEEVLERRKALQNKKANPQNLDVKK
jgi:hypothetical protein